MTVAPVSPLLQVADVAKSYRGVRALEGVSFTLAAGGITGLIGPNGSGKTTLIDGITGFQKLDAGQILLAGQDIRGRSPQAIAKAGLVRSFQAVRVYGQFDLRQNLLLASAAFRGVHPVASLLRLPSYRHAQQTAEARAEALLGQIGLHAKADLPAGALSYGQQKLLMLAAALMTAPRLVVLDEPVAGVNPSRVNEVAEILRDLHTGGTDFLIVEHNVAFIASLCDEILVLDQGRLLMQGPPALVQQDLRVLAAYLGMPDAA